MKTYFLKYIFLQAKRKPRTQGGCFSEKKANITEEHLQFFALIAFKRQGTSLLMRLSVTLKSDNVGLHTVFKKNYTNLVIISLHSYCPSIKFHLTA